MPKTRKRIRPTKASVQAELDAANARLAELEAEKAAVEAIPVDPKLFVPIWNAVGSMSTYYSGIDFNLEKSEAEALANVTVPVFQKYFGQIAGSHPELAALVMTVSFVAMGKVSAHNAKSGKQPEAKGSIDDNGAVGPGKDISNKALDNAP